ncbi:MAG TPA: glycosyl transferase family 1 [Microscillaceae bacterium]|jgi:glycosyltransferase involved in cell wall biosynthesis|nr:glycosyl transferase family 1 [Microscillaceae bacterium]
MPISSSVLKPVKVTYILANVTNAISFEWIAAKIDKTRCHLDFVLLINHTQPIWLEQWLQQHQVPCRRLNYRSKLDFFRLFFQVWLHLRRNRSQVIHTHIFEACLIGFLAGIFAGIRKRLYTRHHSTLHHRYFPRAVWYDRFINFLATDIIAISGVVRQVLIEKEKVNPAKVHLIHHGFDLPYFTEVSQERVEQLRQKYGLAAHQKVVGVVSRYTHFKGIEYIVDAFAMLLRSGVEARLLLANALGDYKATIQQHLAQLPADSYLEIEYERDMPALYRCMDVFVHTPIEPDAEAFGQTYVECMLTGVPAIITLSGIAHEYARHSENAWVVGYENSESIYQGLQALLDDKDMCEQIGKNAQNYAVNHFSFNAMFNKLVELYL